MKLCVRKIYCSTCKKLVRCQEKKVNGDMFVSCPNCKTVLWSWRGVRWVFTGSSPGKIMPTPTRAAKTETKDTKPAKAEPAAVKDAKSKAAPAKSSKTEPVSARKAKTEPASTRKARTEPASAKTPGKEASSKAKDITALPQMKSESQEASSGEGLKPANPGSRE